MALWNGEIASADLFSFYGSCLRGLSFLVCSSVINVLIRNGLIYVRFAEKSSGINVLLQTTNLGVSGSNPFGRATFSRT
jgi:hypothetical protein